MPQPTDVRLPAQLSAEEQQNVARVTRGLAGAVNQRGGGLTLRLTPPQMGVVRIHMQMTDNVIRAQLNTQNEAARGLLQSQMSTLRQTLESQGLVVERLSVHTMPQTASSSNAGNDPQGQSHDGRSRGSYTPQQQGGDGRRQQGDRGQRFEQQLAGWE